jgi:amino acid transporter
MYITVVVALIICVLQGINYWRQSNRLFYRKWRRWGSAIALGIILAVVLLLVMRFVKGDSVALDTNDKRWILALFSIGMLIYLFGRYKFKNWHNED